MNKLVKEFIAVSIDFLCLNYFNRHINRNNVVIFTYHGVLPASLIDCGVDFFAYRNVVSEDEFEKQVRFIKKKFNLISLADLKTVIESPNNKNSKPYAIITFDDGFENNYRYAYPILKKYDATATFFITTDFIGLKKLLWTEEINCRILITKPQKLDFEVNSNKINILLDSFSNREKASITFRTLLKQCSKKEIISVMDELRSQTKDVVIDNIPGNRYQFMNWQQIKEIDKNGMTIGSHTKDHFLLNNLNESEAVESLTISQKVIENNLQKKCRYFAYPNGDKGDFCKRDLKILKDLEYTYALTQIPGYNPMDHIIEHQFELKRTNITHLMSSFVFKSVSSGIWSKIK